MTIKVVQTPDFSLCKDKITATKNKCDSEIFYYEPEAEIPQPSLFGSRSIIVKDMIGMDKKTLQSVMKQLSAWDDALIVTINMRQGLLADSIVITPPSTLNQWCTLLISPQGYHLPITPKDVADIVKKFQNYRDVIAVAQLYAATGIYPDAFCHNEVATISSLFDAAMHHDYHQAVKLCATMPKSMVFPAAKSLHTFYTNILLAHDNIGDTKPIHRRLARDFTISDLAKIIYTYPSYDTCTPDQLIAIIRRIHNSVKG